MAEYPSTPDPAAPLAGQEGAPIPAQADGAEESAAGAAPGKPQKSSAGTAKATKPAKATKAKKAAKATKSVKATKTAKATRAPKAAKPPVPAAVPADAPQTGPVLESRPASVPPTQPEPTATAGAVGAAPTGTAGAAPAVALTAPPGAWAQAAWDSLQRLDQPPLRLAELAVAELGPRAAGWAHWLRQTYPDAPAHGLARLATWQATRGGLALALAEAGGPYSAPLLVPANAWVKVTVVLRIAAAHGHDPTAPQRVADLITLLDLDPAEHDQSPRRSWSSSGENPAYRAEQLQDRGLAGGGIAGVAWLAGRFGLVRFATGRLRIHRAAAAALRGLLAASDRHDSLQRLAHRADRHYRQAQPAGA